MGTEGKRGFGDYSILYQLSCPDKLVANQIAVWKSHN